MKIQREHNQFNELLGRIEKKFHRLDIPLVIMENDPDMEEMIVVTGGVIGNDKEVKVIIRIKEGTNTEDTEFIEIFLGYIHSIVVVHLKHMCTFEVSISENFLHNAVRVDLEEIANLNIKVLSSSMLNNFRFTQSEYTMKHFRVYSPKNENEVIDGSK